MIRPCKNDDVQVIYDIINDAAMAYKGVIPDDRWHEPYMPMEELLSEISEGVAFWGYDNPDTGLIGVMGIQDRVEVDLIRHAYVYKSQRGKGVGSRLLKHLESQTDKPILIGMWAEAEWAIRFYQKHGYKMVTPEETGTLLRRFWDIPERQIETSVVMGNKTWRTFNKANTGET